MHDICKTNPCQSGGICSLDSSSKAGFTCSCPNGYFGASCQNSNHINLFGRIFQEINYELFI